MSKRIAILAAAALLALSAGANAQSIGPPWTYPPTLTATPVQVLPVDLVRRRIIFFNPSATASIAFCASTQTRAAASYTCAVNGAGSITLKPYGSFVLDGGTPTGPALAMSAAWIGVASSGSVPATILEFE